MSSSEHLVQASQSLLQLDRQLTANPSTLSVQPFSLVRSNSADAQGITVGGSAGATTLRFQWTSREAAYSNEIGVFAIDEFGRVNGIAPGEAGYAQAALTSSTRQVLFSSGQQAGAWKELSFQPETQLAFYLIQNSTTEAWLANNPRNNSNQPLALFSIETANFNRFDYVQSRALGEGLWQFAWEDVTNGGDRDFNDVVFTVSRPGIAVPGTIGQTTPTRFSWLSRSAAYQNEMGLFFVDDAEGRIGNLRPGDPGYAQAALAAERRQVVFAQGQTSGAVSDLNLPAKQWIGWYLIPNATTEQFLQQNPSNRPTGGIVAFFSYPGANPDGLAHLNPRSANEFGWEDLTSGGDRDFDDLVFRFEFGQLVGGITPRISIEDVRLEEGNSGIRQASFTVRLSEPSDRPIQLNYSTIDGSATADVDYQLASGQLTFAAGETTQTIAVAILSDLLQESDETFSLTLSNPINAILERNQGIATILDDDQPASLNVLLSEDDAFQRTYTQTLQIPLEPSILTISYQDLNFDVRDTTSIKDAFEVRLIDRDGQPLVYQIDRGRDTFFNLTEGIPALLAAGTTLTEQTIRLDLSSIAPGTEAQLVLQLVNNDSDTETSVRITNIAVTPSTEEIAPVGIVARQAALSTGFTLLPQEEYDRLSDVSPSFRADYGITSFNQQMHTLYTNIALRNIGQYSVAAPLIVVVDRLSDASVRVLNADGILPDGRPYFEFTTLVSDPLQPNSTTEPRSLAFLNPDRVQFTYELQILGQLPTGAETVNRSPVFTSLPIETAIVGSPYIYTVAATDPDGDSLTYSLVASPATMTIDAATGEIRWTPSAAETTAQSDQSVVVRVTDGKGGEAQQQFSIWAQSTIATNAAPVITSNAITQASIDQPYRYDVDAIDADNDLLQYSLVTAPQGMVIDAASGQITWNATDQATGEFAVVVRVTDNRGGTGEQSFSINRSATALSEIQGLIWDDRNGNTIRDSNLIQGANPDIAFIIDISFSTDDPFQGAAVGDLNGDRRSNTILDAEIAAFIALNQQLIRQGLGQTARVGVISFAIFASSLDVDPVTPGQQLVTNPSADRDRNGVLDIEQALRSLRSLPSTNFEAALQQAQSFFTTLGTPGGNGNIVFLSDGVNVTANAITDEVERLRGLGVNLSAFGVGEGAQLNDGDTIADDLVLIDPDARIFTSPDELLGVFGGLTGNNGFEPGMTGVRVYLDLNNNGTLDADEPIQTTIADDPNTLEINETGQYSFTGLQPGTYTVRQVVPVGFQQTFPGNAGGKRGDGYADVVLEYFANGRSPSPLPEPYGSTGGSPPRTVENGSYTIERVNPNVVLGAPPPSPIVGWNPQVNWLALPEGSYVTVGFVDETVIDGTGDDIFIRSFDPADSAGESADIFVSADGTNFTLLGRVAQNGRQGLDLATIDFTQAVRAVRIVGVDSRGTSPGFDLVSVEVLPESVGAADGSHIVTLDANQTVRDRNFGNTVGTPQPNRSPNFTTTAPSNAEVGVLLRYDARAVDPDGDSITYELFQAPRGMIVDPVRGVVVWQPTADQRGTVTVTLRAQDGRGGSAIQQFDLTIGSNQPPRIVSVPEVFARLEQPYVYDVLAIDPEAQPLIFSLLNQPAGMTINAAGEIRWTPTIDQAGAYPVTVQVQDQSGQTIQQTFNLVASTNAPPRIVSTAPTTITQGRPYRYDVQAIDPEGTPLSFSVNGVAGMTIDQLGRLSWETTQAGEYAVSVTATDQAGISTTQTFNLTVQADTQAPSVDLRANNNLIEVGGTVTLFVNATDNTGVETVSLTLNGREIDLAGNVATVRIDQPGLYTVLATARDAAGNEGTDTLSLRVTNPADDQAPEIQILSPTTQQTIANLTDIVGTVTDTDLEFYRVEYAPISAVDLNNLAQADPDYITIAQGTTNVTNGLLAQFDPTLVRSEDYVIRVIAQDINGRINSRGILLGVAGENKLGNFQIELTDLSIPIAGIPIQVQRVYDTLQTRDRGDFGYGWSLKVQDAQIRESVPVTELEQLGVGSLFGAMPFSRGTRVYLTNPEGRRVGFTFEPFIETVSLLGSVWKPRFVADPGVYDVLETDNTPLSQKPDGTFGLFLFGFSFNPENYKLTAKNGITYTYNQFEGLQQIQDRNGNRLTFNDAGIFSSTGASVQFGRDPQGRITQIIDPSGRAIQYSYDTAGNLVRVTDQAGLTTTHSYLPTRSHYLASIVDPRGKTTLQTQYDAQGRAIGTTDALGRTISSSYRSTTTGSTITQIDPLGNATITTRDSRGNIIAITDSVNATTTFTYDDNNNLISTTDARGFTTTRTYDDRGNLTSITDTLGQTQSFTYDAFNNITTETDQLGRTSRFVYNANGNLLEFNNAAGQINQFAYDSFGRVSSFTDAKNHTTTYSYSGSSTKPTGITFPDGSTQRVEYNSFGQITRLIDENGHATEYVADSIGRLVARRDPLGNQTTYTYDAQLITSITDPLGNTVRFEYDDAGRLIRQIDPIGRVTQYGYDALGRRTTETDPLGRTQTTTYRADGLIASITDAAGNITRFEYDLTDNQTGVIDPLGQRTTFAYDALNRQIRKTDPLGYSATYAYDAVGNLIEVLDRNDRLRRFSYNAIDQLTQEAWFNGSTPTQTIDLAYDAVGNLVDATDPTGTLTFSYDRRDRVIETTSAGIALTYRYDAAGNRISVNDNRGTRVDSMYDPRNLLMRQTWQGGVNPIRVEYSYDQRGDRTETRRFADLAGTQLAGRTTYSYDALQRLTALTHFNGANAALADYQYAYNLANQLIRKTVNGETTLYNYDRTNQLINADRPGQADEAYSYDPNGNRTNNGFVITANNQVASDGTFNYSYDREGNLTTKTAITTGATTIYSYDHRNRLISVIDRDGNGNPTQTVEFTYDVFDRRQSKTVNGQATTFVNDGDQLWAELDQSGQVIAHYLSGAEVDEWIARYRSNGETNWYLSDRLGTVQQIANQLGNLINELDYSSFGQILNQTNPSVGNRFAFTGREYDAETGLYYYRARYYDPDLGRFISQDPIGFGGLDYNLYRYVTNNPVNATDPSGLIAVLETVAILNTPAAATSGVVIGVLQGISATTLIFLSNILEIANAGGDVLVEWGTAVDRTEEKLEQLNDIYGFAEKAFGSKFLEGFAGGFEVGTQGALLNLRQNKRIL